MKEHKDCFGSPTQESDKCNRCESLDECVDKMYNGEVKMKVKVRSLYHTPKGERGIGKWIVGWTWVLAVFYSVPHLLKKPPVGSSRWKEYIKALCYNFSHEEIWIADENGNFNGTTTPIAYTKDGSSIEWSKTKITYLGQCFSSTTRGDDDGVRFAPAQDVLGKHPERWYYIEWECEEKYLERAIVFAEMEEGKEYDYAGVSGFVVPLAVQDKLKWFCSEICDWFKWICRIYTYHQKKVSPRRSAYLLAKATGMEPKPLVGEL